MKNELYGTVNKIYLLVYTYGIGKHYETSYLTKKRATEHMQYLLDHGANTAFINEINLWME